MSTVERRSLSGATSPWWGLGALAIMAGGAGAAYVLTPPVRTEGARLEIGMIEAESDRGGWKPVEEMKSGGRLRVRLFRSGNHEPAFNVPWVMTGDAIPLVDADLSRRGVLHFGSGETECSLEFRVSTITRSEQDKTLSLRFLPPPPLASGRLEAAVKLLVDSAPQIPPPPPPQQPRSMAFFETTATALREGQSGQVSIRSSPASPMARLRIEFSGKAGGLVAEAGDLILDRKGEAKLDLRVEKDGVHQGGNRDATLRLTAVEGTEVDPQRQTLLVHIEDVDPPPAATLEFVPAEVDSDKSSTLRVSLDRKAEIPIERVISLGGSARRGVHFELADSPVRFEPLRKSIDLPVRLHSEAITTELSLDASLEGGKTASLKIHPGSIAGDVVLVVLWDAGAVKEKPALEAAIDEVRKSMQGRLAGGAVSVVGKGGQVIDFTPAALERLEPFAEVNETLVQGVAAAAGRLKRCSSPSATAMLVWVGDRPAEDLFTADADLQFHQIGQNVPRHDLIRIGYPGRPPAFSERLKSAFRPAKSMNSFPNIHIVDTLNPAQGLTNRINVILKANLR